jgi:hypothetical protein
VGGAGLGCCRAVGGGMRVEGHIQVEGSNPGLN